MESHVVILKNGSEMVEQQYIDYTRIEKAIHYIQGSFKDQPSLDDIAAVVGLSPFHFHRLFSAWAGVSPKQFIRYLSLEYAKSLLADGNRSLLDTAYQTGLSGTGRLHDLFVNIERMTPGEFKNGAADLHIHYSFSLTLFGQVIIASTHKGVCYIGFEDDKDRALTLLRERFPYAQLSQKFTPFHQEALFFFQKDWNQIDKIKLHLNGTDFQLKVWESLLKIPQGHLRSYGEIAKSIYKPNASRAVGTAIGSNPVSFLIPCHRVIQASGCIGGYMWGGTRKSAILGWEAAQRDR